MRGKREPLEIRFWQKVEKTDGCWLWTAARYPEGYGIVSVENQKVRGAHRVSYEMANGPIPDGMLVCHKCDVRHCVRPDHLFLGTQKDNMRDMIAKGRHPQHGKTHCVHGHEYTPENTYRNGAARFCRECNRKAQMVYSARKRAEVAL